MRVLICDVITARKPRSWDAGKLIIIIIIILIKRIDYGGISQSCEATLQM